MQGSQEARVTCRSARNMGDAAQVSTQGGGQLSQQQLTSWFAGINQPPEQIQDSNINQNSNEQLPNSTQSNNAKSQGAKQTQSDDDTDSDLGIEPDKLDVDLEIETNLKTI